MLSQFKEQLNSCLSEKFKTKNDIKIEYCLPLGSDYLNRQSATFFISKTNQHSTERMRYQDD